MTEIIISFFVLLGALFMLLGAIAIVRLPDVYTRINAATKASTLGVVGIMIGLFLFFVFEDNIVSGKILLTIIFVFLTAPISGFMMARSAYHMDVPIWKHNTRDDLKDALKQKNK
ncbi:monovalent cation/H(+) antiporter subunit G [Paraliobacillus sediminis]|uniref:monovalent cation/H(+) antiporter subunit G n=1 Tax=Paraliobacillus sediminis TaxID=1885916 RepID=UPI0030842F2D